MCIREEGDIFFQADLGMVVALRYPRGHFVLVMSILLMYISYDDS